MTAFIDELLKPEALPEKTSGVSLVQTHISYVLVADKYVYKIKKPVNFGFLDFSTLEKRKYYCIKEIELNRRLAKDMYIEVLPITRDGDYYIIGEGRGEIVDYAVKMRRIPDHLLMKSVFEQGNLQDDHLREIASLIADFHLKALQTNEIDQYGSIEKFKVNTDENFNQTEKYINASIETEDFSAIQAWTNRFFDENKSLFGQRIENGKIRDCHGDLHMEHICLTDPVSVFDCIEFNDRFRYTDILADIAFLLMDLEYRGGNGYADILWNYYKDITGEEDMNDLLSFYKVYRAYVRGKVISFQLDDPRISIKNKDEAVRTAKKYFKLARAYID